jgi:hypothetical protein
VWSVVANGLLAIGLIKWSAKEHRRTFLLVEKADQLVLIGSGDCLLFVDYSTHFIPLNISNVRAKTSILVIFLFPKIIIDLRHVISEFRTRFSWANCDRVYRRQLLEFMRFSEVISFLFFAIVFVQLHEK